MKLCQVLPVLSKDLTGLLNHSVPLAATITSALRVTKLCTFYDFYSSIRCAFYCETNLEKCVFEILTKLGFFFFFFFLALRKCGCECTVRLCYAAIVNE